MSKKPDEPNPLDPFGTWRSMRDTGMETWSKMMIDLVNSEAYARATGQMLDTYLTVSAPFQRAIETVMTRVLTQLNMPTRADVTGLAERLTNIELRLDDLDARLGEIQRAAAPPAAAAPAPGAEEGRA
ncbi:MAG TPA: hypothetical protein VFW96_12285 [Thermomicrobiales bacterium]|nr:hypothetical protein [Thermomicrobiales bacterium]